MKFYYYYWYSTVLVTVMYSTVQSDGKVKKLLVIIKQIILLHTYVGCGTIYSIENTTTVQPHKIEKSTDRSEEFALFIKKYGTIFYFITVPYCTILVPYSE